MNKKASPRTIIIFILVVVFSGFMGGILSLLLSHAEHPLVNVVNVIRDSLLYYSIYIAIIIQITACVIAFILCKHCSKSYRRWDQEDPDYIEAVESKISYGMLSAEIGSVLSLVFFNIFIVSMDVIEYTPSMDRYTNIAGFLFVIFIVLLLILQRRLIYLEKEINPEKMGDPLDFNFSKQWMKSCDELERQIAYKSAYKAHRIQCMIYIILLCTLMLASGFYRIGVLPFIIIGGMWLSQILIYSITSIKLSKSKHKQQKGIDYD